MKKKELMIGDWLEFRMGDSQVTGITDAGIHFVDRFGKGIASGADPIPLTAEILEKNFPTAEELAWWPVEDGLHCESRNTDDIMVSGVFRFVHQLQHALRVCGIEKEIKL